MPRAFRRIIANYRSNDVDDDDARVLELCAASQLQPERCIRSVHHGVSNLDLSIS